MTGAPSSESEKDIAERELRLKQQEFEWRKKTYPKTWQSPMGLLVIGGLVTLFVTFGVKGIEIVYNWWDIEPDSMRLAREEAVAVAKEEAWLFALINIEDQAGKRTAICDHLKAETFTTPVVGPRFRAIAATQVPPCGQDASLPDEQVASLDCIASAPVSASCSAYDKSGFMAKPHGSCQINLAPDEGKVFDISSFSHETLVDRHRSGDPVERAIKPTMLTGSDRFASAYGGTIRCTNRSGTGRTCEYTARVSVGQVPEACITSPG